MIKLIDLLIEVLDEKKEDRCKRIADRRYSKPSAYKSGAIVRCRDGKIWKDLDEVEGEEPLDENYNLDAVKDIFNGIPELQSIGSLEQYSEYLKTIFPNSKVKDIVYHGTDQDFEKFSRDSTFYKNPKNLNRAFYFTISKDFWKRKNRKSVLLNIVNIADRDFFEDNKEFKELFDDIVKSEGSLHGIKEYSKFLSEVDRKSPYPFENPRVASYMRDNNMSYETPEGGKTYAVFEPEQIHILGSKQDIEDFKKYVGKLNEDESLHKWFKRKGAPGKTGGWVDCNTCREVDGKKKCKPCGKQKGEKRAKYPACRPTPSQCSDPGKGKTWGKTK